MIYPDAWAYFSAVFIPKGEGGGGGTRTVFDSNC